LKPGLFFGVLLLWIGLSGSVQAQGCPNLISPVDGQTNVPVEASISWDPVVGVTGYIISLGTSPGGNDLVNEQQVGNDTFFAPPNGMPEMETIYVTLTLFFFNQENIVCLSQSFTTEIISQPPGCSALAFPGDGATGVNVATNLSWTYAPKATGYRLSLGTSPAGNELLNQADMGTTLSYNPPVNLPFDTTIYVQIEPYNALGEAQGCAMNSFNTASQGSPPDCTYLITPPNGAINVGLSPFLEWEAVADALGYIMSIGSTPFSSDILDQGVFTETATFVLNFESNNTYYVTITPFNDAGQALGCAQESFSTILGCGPFYDPETGALTSYYPDLEFPAQIGLCNNQVPKTISAPDGAHGYRWYKIQGSGEVFLGASQELTLYETGTYRFEAYNTVSDQDQTIECLYSQQFEVSFSGAGQVQEAFITRVGLSFNLEVVADGFGDYVFSLDGENYQPTGFFTGLSDGWYTVFINDLNGCGITEYPLRITFPDKGFPPYFSPNDDGINDFWRYEKPLINPLLLVRTVIFDRYGKTLALFGPENQGWDGTYRGAAMPAEGYWYRATTADGEAVTGYFSLVR
jgi:gliding motility-associated-like protein